VRLLTPLGCLLALLALSGACSEVENLQLELLVVKETSVSDTAGCPARAAGTTDALQEGKFTLRWTFMRRDAQTIKERLLRRQYTLVCDRVVQPNEEVKLQVPLSAGGTMAVRVDAGTWDAARKVWVLQYTGQLEGVDLQQPAVTILMRRTRTLSCVDRAQLARAFHAATLLPNGQVLLTGGLVAGQDGKAEKLDSTNERAYVTGAAEVYDPVSLSFSQVQGSIPARAFHRAHLLPSPPGGPYKILLIGGVKPDTDGQPAFKVPFNSIFPFLVTPADNTSPAPAGLVTFAPASGSDPPRLSFARLTATSALKLMFPSSARLPGSDDLLVAGGGGAYFPGASGGKDPGFAPGAAARLQVSDSGITSTPFSLQRTRVGQTAAPLGQDRVLLVGGTMDGNCSSSADPRCREDHASSVSTGGSAPRASLLTFSDTRFLTLGWHTLEPIGITDAQLDPMPGGTPVDPKNLLLAGGFQLVFETSRLRSSDDRKRVKPQLWLIRDGAPPVPLAVATDSGGHFQPVGYHDAIRLADGRVMLSGGNINSNFTSDTHCDAAGIESTFCAYAQVVFYGLDAAGTAVTRLGGSQLRVRRLGHRSTRLLDNTVLITGGITINAASEPLVLKDAELYNPRNGAAGEDPFGRKPMLDYDQSSNTSGHRCLQQEQ
jgi:hypothetical protein